MRLKSCQKDNGVEEKTIKTERDGCWSETASKTNERKELKRWIAALEW